VAGNAALGETGAALDSMTEVIRRAISVQNWLKIEQIRQQLRASFT
jgi:hypothetical protein